MPTIRDVTLLRQQVVDLLPANQPVVYKTFLSQLSEAGLGEGQAQIEGMKATGMVDRWLEQSADGHVVHYIARPGIRNG